MSLVLLYELHAIDRFPRVQDLVSSCRLVKCARKGGIATTSGTKIGNAYHMVVEATGRCLHANPAGQQNCPLAKTMATPRPDGAAQKEARAV